MDEAINTWLLEYEPINDIAEKIYTEELPDEVETLALQRTGFEELHPRYVNEKGWYRQYQYNLLLKSNSEDDLKRLENLDWLDDFSDWFQDKNRTKDFPVLGDDKKVISVSCANALTYETSEDVTISIYALQIYFNIKKTI